MASLIFKEHNIGTVIVKAKNKMHKKILEKISKVLDDKKGMNIECIDVKEETTLAEYFIIASGTSNTHIRALADNVEEELAKDGIINIINTCYFYIYFIKFICIKSNIFYYAHSFFICCNSIYYFSILST